MIERAEWLPTGRRRWHPSDVAAGRWVVGCGTPLALLAIFGVLSGWLAFCAGLLAVAAMIFGPAFILVFVARPERDDRLFADLGEREPDMAEVRVRLYRRGGLLGEDQGYLWRDGGGTAFQGARFAFRLPGGNVKARPYRFVADCGEGVRLVADPISPGVLPVAGAGEPGRVTLPPAVRDPELRPPGIIGRILFVAFLAWGLARFGPWGWATLAAGTLWTFLPVVRDRRAR